jgi:DNA-binding NtrC family response regulator
MNANKNENVILMVDDEEDFFHIYAWRLERFHQFRYLYAKSGEEAYKILKKQKVDFVISDISMPNGDGLWLLDKLASEYPGIPVIMASGELGITEKDLIARGASAFVPKMDLSLLSFKFSKLVKKPAQTTYSFT